MLGHTGRLRRRKRRRSRLLGLPPRDVDAVGLEDPAELLELERQRCVRRALAVGERAPVDSPAATILDHGRELDGQPYLTHAYPGPMTVTKCGLRSTATRSLVARRTSSSLPQPTSGRRRSRSPGSVPRRAEPSRYRLLSPFADRRSRRVPRSPRSSPSASPLRPARFRPAPPTERDAVLIVPADHRLSQRGLASRVTSASPC